MSEKNFRCPSCKKEFFFSQYVFNGKEYKDRFKKPLVCDCEAGSKLESIDRDKGFCVNLGTFNSMNSADKSKMLKKRSTEHFKKNIEERKHLMDRGKET